MHALSFRHNRRAIIRKCVFVVAASLLLVGPNLAQAARPSAMKLFPEESVVFIRCSNAHELGEKLRQSDTGRMMQDPQLKPFVEALYGKAGELYAKEAESKVGLSWDDIKRLPKGEVAFGVIKRPQKRPALLLMIDQGEEGSVATKLLDRAMDYAQEHGSDISKETISGVEVTTIRDKDRENRMFGVFERENTLVVATDPDVIRGVLYHWDHPEDLTGEAGAAAAEAAPESAAEKTAADEQKDKDKAAADKADDESKKADAAFVPGRTLARNQRFATIVEQCRRPQDPPPQLLFYIDPIELIKNSGRGNAGATIFIGMLPALGIDGLQAIGGTATLATDEYDSLTQFHVQLENPRSGVLLLPAFTAGETAPQPFVPENCAAYITWNGNIRTTYDRVVTLVDGFRYKGSVEKFVEENMSDKIGIDVPKEVIDNLKGRFTWLTGFERPARLQGEQHVFAAELKDEEAAKKSLETVQKKFPEFFEERKFGNVTYYGLKGPRDELPEEERPFNPCIAIMDGYLFVCSSCQRFEQCVAAHDGTADRLVDSSDYARTSAVIGRETRGVTPIMFSISRPAETMRQWYEMLTSEKTRALINEHKEDSAALQALADVMDQHQLPPFEVLEPYLAPGGGILYDTDSGYHGISFQLRNEVKDAPPAAEAAAK